MPSYEPVVALSRGLEVLEAIADLSETTVGELHRATGIPKPTLVRILETLIHVGYVFSFGDPARYALTARNLKLSSGVRIVRYLRTRLGEALLAFQQKSAWPSDIAIFDQNAMVVVDTNLQPGLLTANWQVGTRVSAVHTALGKAYLAYLPDEERGAVLARLKTATGEPGDIAAFEDELRRTREDGFAANDREFYPNVISLAAPIFENGKIIASVNITTLTEAMSIAELKKRHAEGLMEAAQQMSQALSRPR